VIIAPGATDPEGILRVITLVRSLLVRVSVLPALFEAVGSAAEFDSVGGPSASRRAQLRPEQVVPTVQTGASTSSAPGSGSSLSRRSWWSSRWAIKLDSKGPILFLQRRIGLDGEDSRCSSSGRWWMAPMRARPTLLDLNEADGLFKIADDPRFTPVGRLIRPSS